MFTKVKVGSRKLKDMYPSERRMSLLTRPWAIKKLVAYSIPTTKSTN